MTASQLRAKVSIPAILACSDLTFRTTAGAELVFERIEVTPAPKDDEGKLAGVPSATLIFQPAAEVRRGESEDESRPE